MTTVRLKYLHCFNDRHGKPHYYFRYRGQRWPIPAPGTEGFATAYDALLARVKANPFAIRRNVEFMPGSLGWAIEQSVMVRRQLRELGINGCATHGLRKNATSELISGGCTDQQAAALSRVAPG